MAVFAENAGGSQVLSSVALSITSYLLSTNVQMASYALATASERNVSLGTCAAAVLIGAESADDVMIGQSATSLVASIAAMIENCAKWRPDHEIVISDADHETNRGAWTRLSQRLGTKLVHWPVQSTCKQNQYAVTLNPLTLKAIVTPSTKLVAFTACSNLLGAFTDVVKAVEIIRSIAPDAMNIPVQDAGELVFCRSVSTDLHTESRAAPSQRALDAMRRLRAAHRNTCALVDRP